MPLESPSSPQPMPQMPMSDNPSPDYNFIYDQPKRHHFLSGKNSFVTRLVLMVAAFLLLVILIIIIKGLVTSSPFNKSDYDIVVERQQEMLHILSADITSSNTSQLSITNQNFVATTIPSLMTAQSKTLSLLNDYNDKISSSTLSAVHNSAVDQELTSAVSSNNLNSVFQSVMLSQLNYYIDDLKAAYSSTNVSSGRSLLRAEYSEAKLLLSDISS